LSGTTKGMIRGAAVFPLGNITFTPDTLHDLRSISKSIVSLLYGIALSEGKVPLLETSLVDEFPAYDELVTDPERRRITVEHAVTTRTD
jgi:CubicO group peptidase (beta-lactamase class C family)